MINLARLGRVTAVWFVALVLPLAFLTRPLQAQEAVDTLRGSVVLQGQPVPNTPVTLHRVTPDQSGEVATATTDDSGVFTFPLVPDENARFTVFFVTAEYLSVRYFGQPVHLTDPSEGYTVAVFDTTSTPSAPVRINRRDVVLIPQENLSWEVNEIISILNPDERAVVSQSGLPTLEITIPEDAANFQAGEGDILPHEVSIMQNRVLLLTPVIPGRRDLFIRYRLPAEPTDAGFPIDQPTDTFNLYVEQPSHLTAVEGLSSTQMIDVEGDQFLQYSGAGMSVGQTLLLEWQAGSPVDPVTVGVGVTILLLAAGAFLAIRNRRTFSAS